MSLHYDGAVEEVVIYPDFCPVIEIDGEVEIDRRIRGISGSIAAASTLMGTLEIV